MLIQETSLQQHAEYRIQSQAALVAIADRVKGLLDPAPKDLRAPADGLDKVVVSRGALTEILLRLGIEMPLYPPSRFGVSLCWHLLQFLVPF